MPAQTVKTSYVPGTDFSKYHTYTWISIKGAEHPNPDLDTQIKQAMDSQLAAKGLAKTDGTADLLVDYQIAVSKTETWQVYEDWGSAALLDGRIPQRRKVTIDTGTLVLDMYDPPARHLVWTGTATKTIDPKSTPEARQKAIERAAKNLLKDYPPK